MTVLPVVSTCSAMEHELEVAFRAWAACGRRRGLGERGCGGLPLRCDVAGERSQEASARTEDGGGYEIIPNDMLIPANERQIAAVFVCSDPVDWGRDLQVLCDVLRAGGYPRDVDSSIPQPPVFSAADDFEYPTKFLVPKFGTGTFRIILESLYGKLMKRPLAFTSFPKVDTNCLPPGRKNSAQQCRDDLFPGQNDSSFQRHFELPEPGEKDCALKTLFMIGDNPETDIAGAIGVGRPWFSILVRSVDVRGTGNHDKYPTDKVVDDVYEAVDFIFKRERIST